MFACEFLPSTLGAAPRMLLGVQRNAMIGTASVALMVSVFDSGTFKGTFSLEVSTGGLRKGSQSRPCDLSGCPSGSRGLMAWHGSITVARRQSTGISCSAKQPRITGGQRETPGD